MKRLATYAVCFATLSLTAAAFASDAETSATAGSNRSQPTGTAAATARYEGDQGFARTDTRSGSVNLARGVAVGVDEHGLSLSVSSAIAPRSGPALATTFNLSIGTDGRVSGSTGLAVSNGPAYRSATAGGQTATGRSGAGAVATASGKTDPAGRVTATTNAYDRRPLVVSHVRAERYERPVRVIRSTGSHR